MVSKQAASRFTGTVIQQAKQVMGQIEKHSKIAIGLREGANLCKISLFTSTQNWEPSRLKDKTWVNELRTFINNQASKRLHFVAK